MIWPCRMLVNNDIVRNIDLYYYYSINLQKYSKNQAKAENINMNDNAYWKAQFVNKNVVILEVNESFFNKEHIKAFLNDSINYLSANTNGPMDKSALKYSMDMQNIPKEVKVNEPIPVEIKIKNAGNMVWKYQNAADNSFALLLGYHVIAGGKNLGEGRISKLTKDVSPNEEIILKGKIGAFKTPGVYTIKIDMLQEKYVWFENVQGNNNIPITVNITVK